MALYRYTSNKSPWEETSALIVGYDDDGTAKVMQRGGDPVELTDEEVARARRNYNITELSEAQVEKFAEKAEEQAEASGANDSPAKNRRRKRSEAAAAESQPDANSQPADENAGGVVDPTQGGGTGQGAGASVGDGQGTRGASGQDAGTTDGGTR
jgi:sRNA-binding protein